MIKKGFTLIELLVVIAIIGLLTTLSVASFNSAREKSRNTKRLTDVKRIQMALESYYNNVGTYPNSIDERIASDKPAAVYLSPTPIAPTPVDGNCTIENNSYVYARGDSGQSYNLSYCLSGQNGGPKTVNSMNN